MPLQCATVLNTCSVFHLTIRMRLNSEYPSNHHVHTFCHIIRYLQYLHRKSFCLSYSHMGEGIGTLLITEPCGAVCHSGVCGYCGTVYLSGVCGHCGTVYHYRHLASAACMAGLSRRNPQLKNPERRKRMFHGCSAYICP